MKDLKKYKHVGGKIEERDIIYFEDDCVEYNESGYYKVERVNGSEYLLYKGDRLSGRYSFWVFGTGCEKVEPIPDPMGINFRSLMDGTLALALRGYDEYDLSNYDSRNDFIDMIEARLMECDWISMSNGTTFEKTFVPTKK